MREILFRGKRIDNSEWVKGIYSPYDWDFFDNRGNQAQMIIVSDDDDDGFWCDVISETVGQYTGLTDKNGNKIFEGDILQNTKTKVTAVVQWFPECSAFMVWCKSENYVGFLYECNESIIEIIGNIHDNPELLKGE